MDRQTKANNIYELQANQKHTQTYKNWQLKRIKAM